MNSPKGGSKPSQAFCCAYLVLVAPFVLLYTFDASEDRFGLEISIPLGWKNQKKITKLRKNDAKMPSLIDIFFISDFDRFLIPNSAPES